MIDHLHPYPEYRDSGVAWLGQVPAHWEVLSLSRIGHLFKGNGGNKGDEVAEGIPCVRYGDLYTRHEHFIRRTKAFLSPDRARDYTPIRYGDVLFAASGETIDDIGKSAVNLLREDARCGGDILILRPAVEAVPEYLGYACDCPASRAQKARMGRGFTVVHIYGSQLKKLLLPLPPLPEQTAIVRFLDYADRRLRRVIRARRRLVKLLEEYRQALIHQTVTGRIDVRTGRPYPAYKDAGVEWLGQVPAHWEVRKLRQCVSIIGGMTPSMEVRRFWGGNIPWITPKDMKQQSLHDSLVKVTYEALAETPLKLIEPPAILLVVRGMILARRVPVGITAIPVTINQDMKALLPKPDVDADFLVRLLSAARDAFVPLIDEAGHGTRRLPTERFRELGIPLPPLPEQTAIVDYLDAQTGKIDRAIEDARREIELLKEFRTRLIADVVTGKLDVRAAAARLPETDPLAEDDAPDDADAEDAEDADTEGDATDEADLLEEEAET
ncbi:restriction endonuclease subunit S [Rhodocaloribacter litoris]|uniref:restriction endonuclease subunit S n=1 Tax=Rhodocaloribacter litoris TaxID=2558931 RepID=UPI001421A020|nr:restriction endonuclease subunit S [Rhodocaloribacter litoris]QXD16757.1 restriction endonuclease subunit S [Rhodocaloribacter litoris]